MHTKSVITENTQEDFTKKHGRVQPKSALVELTLNFTQLIRPTMQNIAVYREQFYTLVLNASASQRQEISYLLSSSEYAPKPIIIFLAMEEIGIARSVLQKSPVLTTKDLAMMAGKVSFAHQKFIAQRSDIDIEVVQALLDADRPDQNIRTVLETNPICNENAAIASYLYAPDETIEMEEPADVITTVDTNPIARLDTKPKQKDLSKDLLALANRGGRLSRAPLGKSPKSNDLPLNRKQMERQLLASARAHDIRSFAHFIERFCGLEREVTLDFLMKQNAGMLATLLCALELSNISAARILLLLNYNIGRNGLIFHTVMKKYSKLDKQECTAFFEKYGASFKDSVGVERFDPKTTRYALSLAARERRAALLKKQDAIAFQAAEEKLSA